MMPADIIAAHAAAYPDMTARDLCKLCYQAEFGGGHLLSDPAAALERLKSEYMSAQPSNEPLFTPVGGGHSRLSLSAARSSDIAPELVFDIFKASARESGSPAGFERRAAGVARLLREGAAPVSPAEFEEELAALRAGGYAPVSHSEVYRSRYSPSYRVVDSRFAPLIGLLLQIDRRLSGSTEDRALVVALDGMAGSGKSSAAELISRIYGCPVVHTDDFFLPPELRTRERFAAPGGNIHYERLLGEVVCRLSSPPFSYRIFDCSRMAYNGSRELFPSPLILVEGSYSLHPALGDYAGLRVFFRTSPEEQLRRITERNGNAEAFSSRWIPLEQEYFSAFGICENSDIIIDT